MKENRLLDNHNRQLNYLRISITDRCNLRCTYCVPRNLIPKIAYKKILRYEEILRLIRIGVRLGISKIRITGGEPLVRKGVSRFLNELNNIDGLDDLSLTTNGVLLTGHLKNIWEAGIRRINISLDTLKKGKFLKLTGVDGFHKVWEGLMEAHRMGFSPIKINVVALKGINDDEFPEFARLSFQYPFHIRFIEYMPMGNAQLNKDHLIPASDIKKRLEREGRLDPVETGQNDGPAVRFRFDGAKGEIGFIRPITHHFCQGCNRLRLTARGRLRPCLMSDQEIDLMGPLREGCLDDTLRELFLDAVRQKPLEHDLAIEEFSRVESQMSSIGG